MIKILPAIDIIGGRCVRLSQGDYAQKKVYDASPADMAAAYSDCGVSRIHIVDLDGARLSAPANLKVLEEVASRCTCEIEWGGGISSGQALADVFNAGATQAIIGSVAALHPEQFSEWLGAFGGSKLILGADVRDGKVAVKGWQEETAQTIDSLVEAFLPAGLGEVICTDIGRDGMLQGPSTGLYIRLQNQWKNVDFTVSGGISCMNDIETLNEAGLRRVIVGKAIYENRITLKDIERWSLNA